MYAAVASRSTRPTIQNALILTRVGELRRDHPADPANGKHAVHTPDDGL